MQPGFVAVVVPGMADRLSEPVSRLLGVSVLLWSTTETGKDAA